MSPEFRTSKADRLPANRVAPIVRGALSAILALLAIAVASGGDAHGQDIGHVFDNDQIQKAAQSLKAQLKKSSGAGLAEARLDEVTFVAARVKSGRAEIHKTSDDVFVVLSGEATLVTGGTVVNPTGTEEIRGDSIEGGTSAKLEKGEVIHIPQAIPHQLLLPNGGTFLYVLIKIPR